MYEIKRIEAANYKDIIFLYKVCFGISIDEQDVKKKYDTSVYHLIKHIGFLAFNEKKEVAAYYGVFPMILSYNNQDILVAQSGDTMTSPDHQKKGLFTLLANETYQLADELKVPFVFGFPNKNSYPGFAHKLGWQFTGNLKMFTHTVSTIPLCELASKYHFLKRFYRSFVNWRIKQFIVELKEINFDKFNYSNTAGVLKKDFYFFENCLAKENNYLVRLNGFVFLIKVDTHLYIGDIEKFDDINKDKLLDTLKQLANILLCRKIVLNMSENHWMYPMISKIFSKSEGLPIGFKIMSNEIDVNDIQFIQADFDTF